MWVPKKGFRSSYSIILCNTHRWIRRKRKYSHHYQRYSTVFCHEMRSIEWQNTVEYRIYFMTEGNEIYRKNERVNDSEYNFLNIPNKNMNPYRVEWTIPRAYFCLVMMWIFEFPTDSTVCITCIPLPLQIQNFLRNHLIISRVDLIFVSCLWVLSKRPSMHTLKLLALKITSYGKYCVLINLHSGGIYIQPQLLKYRCLKNLSLEMFFL